MKRYALVLLLLLAVSAYALNACSGSTTLKRAGTPWKAGDIFVPGGDTTPPDVSAGIVASVATPYAGQAVTFSIDAVDNSGGALTYAWSDGGAGGVFVGTGAIVTWSIDTAGVYTISVEVTDPSGNVSTASFEVEVTEEPIGDVTPPDLGAGITASASTVETGVPVTLSVSATDDSGGALTYVWSDGGAGGLFTGEGSTVTWVIETAGVFTITVAVSDEAGNTSQATVQITVTEPFVPVTQFETVRAALDFYLSGAAPVIKASDLFDFMIDGDPATDPYVLSVRGTADYETGHIPGAENIPWKQIAKTENLAGLPTNKQIVVYCYTGHTGQVAATVLGALGYDVINMKFGMMAWTQHPNVRVQNPFREGIDSFDFPIETTINTPVDTFELPELNVTTSTEPEEIVRASADAYLSRTGMSPVIGAQQLFDILYDGDPANDPVVVSVRSPEDYAKGHIAGAINIPWKQIGNAEKLAMLPADKKIVVYCYTGHTGQAAATALNMLGYDAVNLKFGMMAWTQNETVRAQQPFSEEFEAHGYDFEGAAWQSEVVRRRLDTFLDSSIGPVITADVLFDNLYDGDPVNDPFVISVRSAEHFAIGHIPGAINIPYKTIAGTSNLSLIPSGKKVVIYCYTGHTGQIANTVLGALGFDTANLKFGMMSWTQDEAVRVQQPFREGIDSFDFPFQTTPNTLPATNMLPVIDVSSSSDVYEITRAAAEAYLTRDGMTPVMSAQALFDILNDGDPANDPIVLSVRSTDHYNIGHVPGAINIPWRKICKYDNLRTLPVDNKIVVYCYTGHTGQAAATALNMLGYDAVNMKFGMMAWTQDEAVRVQPGFVEGVDSHDYPVEP